MIEEYLKTICLRKCKNLRFLDTSLNPATSYPSSHVSIYFLLCYSYHSSILSFHLSSSYSFILSSSHSSLSSLLSSSYSFLLSSSHSSLSSLLSSSHSSLSSLLSSSHSSLSSLFSIWSLPSYPSPLFLISTLLSLSSCIVYTPDHYLKPKDSTPRLLKYFFSKKNSGAYIIYNVCVL